MPVIKKRSWKIFKIKKVTADTIFACDFFAGGWPIYNGVLNPLAAVRHRLVGFCCVLGDTFGTNRRYGCQLPLVTIISKGCNCHTEADLLTPTTVTETIVSNLRSLLNAIIIMSLHSAPHHRHPPHHRYPPTDPTCQGFEQLAKPTSAYIILWIK